MTEFSIPPVVIDYGGWWIDVNLKEDPRTWAQRTAPQVLSRWGWRGARHKKQLTSMLVGAAEIARKAQDAIGVLLLYPELGKSIRALVRSIPFDLSGHDEDSAWTAMLGALTPAEGDGLSAREPEVTDISTPAGACKRLRFEQPLGNENALGEQLAYMWVFPQYGAGVVLTTMFSDLAEAGRWRPALDDLARCVTLGRERGMIVPPPDPNVRRQAGGCVTAILGLAVIIAFASIEFSSYAAGHPAFGEPVGPR